MVRLNAIADRLALILRLPVLAGPFVRPAQAVAVPIVRGERRGAAPTAARR